LCEDPGDILVFLTGEEEIEGLVGVILSVLVVFFDMVSVD
jgi:HrpA-like RNA helicase